ncbi:hypothetical protein [Amycolatopsis sp. PS_44_ISF1]|uniref:hypothetical protein n=1 Tax=Amycolatopsis sp. PS_44_ISF1 TaxID=2974917 RepID=UPI0028DD7537|nr:hypothetical protein [Amycolatopsis sp. PS_44_ISF1]MDT8913521.1 hypothetical protein [Amycolatopsis sp. PS_44_ISF1]
MVAHVARWMAGQEKVVRSMSCWPMVREVAEGAALRLPPSVPAHWHQGLYSGVLALAVYRIWASSKRTVFPIHPQLVDELEDSTSGELPGPIFDRLPRPDPLVLFPRPLPVTTPDGLRGRILGFFVYGRSAETRGRFCSTDDPARDALAIMAVTSLVDEHGHEQDVDLTRLTVPVGRERFTIEAATENTLKAFGAEPGMELMSGAMRTWVSTLTRAAMHALLYLCSDQPDVATRPVPQRRGSGRGKGSAEKPPQIYNVGWALGPALHEARGASTDVGPATFRTIWATSAVAEPTLLFHRADQRIDDHLASSGAELTALRQQLHDSRRVAEALRARTIDLDMQVTVQRETIASLQASRMRLAQAALRYRAEAAAVGSPEHLDSLQQQLRRRDDELVSTLGTIDELAMHLQHARHELEQRPARHRWPLERDTREDTEGDTSPEGEQEPAPSTWLQLCEAAARLPHIWCSPELAEIAAQLPVRRDWLATTWRAMRALSGYAAAKAAARSTGHPLTPLRNFPAYLHADIDGPKISAAQVAAGESESVMNNPRLRALRERPAPIDVDARGAALYLAHIRISQTGAYPRLHFLDATEKTGLICIGYLGPHLPTS